ncbi:uncharacterized protein [Nicotiana sylvestris]|uniref:uncharacterized protein n=1 Tax=Nicotiana sylvestris TaxID=4096 RepID=UPI00388CBEB3
MYEVQKDLSSVSQGSYDVGGYFNKVKRLCDEMNSLDADSYCVCECNCGGKYKMIRRAENQKLIQFQMGLNELYGNARGNIIMMEPLPDVSKAYSLIIQDKKQRGIHNVPVFQFDAASFSAGSSVNPNGTKYTTGPSNSNPRYNFSTTNQTHMYNGDSKKFFCKYCKKNGHTIEKYFKLHGYPQNSKHVSRSMRVAANACSSSDGKLDNYSQ